MSRPVQVFDAPAPLEIDPSPWFDAGHVRIPLEYWSLLLDFAERLDPEAALRLSALSGTALTDEIPLVPDELKRDRAFLARVLDELEGVSPLIAEPDDEYPEAYPNAEIARMGRAALAVFDTALERGEPFRAWDE
ncbi:hypothetical protein OM076_44315 [Solirubrobacter ginsenosidimutans]|uniref:Uncharacterized protein n=1 Tax=Solirubrobacter ginsenosidimutans TaxID=490573 RepID=A0A9X3N502_9ACTN|nr:hypothetical protein [Solirubrobacter ginsenosidimutans]MDA0167366.1 hypothetical protein [Solirubrobacter ginsenosidimutans]